MKKITILILLLFALFNTTVFSQSTATFDITFTSIWNATDHTSVPSSAHWSRLVGATHKTENLFLEIGQLATTGIKNVAESGSNTVFNTEVNNAITNGEADRYINGSGLGAATGNIVIADLEVTNSFPLISLVSMIAPSPDWVIGLNSFSLLDTNGNWKNNITIDMFAYDVGTDSGTNYTSANTITNPFQPISKITGIPFDGKKIGMITITLKSVLNLDKINTLNNLKIYPNPSNGNLNISNIESINIKKIEIFNLIGAKVFEQKKDISSKNTTLSLQVLNKGVYLLKLTSDENKTRIQKLIIN
jgi:hypothetical protein